MTRSGLTLVEVMVALAIVAIALTSVVTALPQLPAASATRRPLRAVKRAEAVRTARQVRLEDSSGAVVAFLPDGRIVEFKP